MRHGISGRLDYVRMMVSHQTRSAGGEGQGYGLGSELELGLGLGLGWLQSVYI